VVCRQWFGTKQFLHGPSKGFFIPRWSVTHLRKRIAHSLVDEVCNRFFAHCCMLNIAPGFTGTSLCGELHRSEGIRIRFLGSRFHDLL